MDTRSHPTWVRGLKHLFSLQIFYDILVAPYVGAWIETSSSALYRANKAVAPYVGAWIETLRILKAYHRYSRRTLRGCVD